MDKWTNIWTDEWTLDRASERVARMHLTSTLQISAQMCIFDQVTQKKVEDDWTDGQTKQPTLIASYRSALVQIEILIVSLPFFFSDFFSFY